MSEPLTYPNRQKIPNQLVSGLKQQLLAGETEDPIDPQVLEEDKQAEAVWERGAGKVANPRGCAHMGQDRACAACGGRYCQECQPEGQGANCKRCWGPVWLDSETRPPEGRNPVLKNY